MTGGRKGKRHDRRPPCSGADPSVQARPWATVGWMDEKEAGRTMVAARPEVEVGVEVEVGCRNRARRAGVTGDRASRRGLVVVGRPRMARCAERQSGPARSDAVSQPVSGSRYHGRPMVPGPRASASHPRCMHDEFSFARPGGSAASAGLSCLDGTRTRANAHTAAADCRAELS